MLRSYNINVSNLENKILTNITSFNIIVHVRQFNWIILDWYQVFPYQRSTHGSVSCHNNNNVDYRPHVIMHWWIIRIYNKDCLLLTYQIKNT